jgi:hypothetical protein
VIEQVFTVTANGKEDVPLPQIFVGVTITLPETADPEKLTVIEFVFVPVAIEYPKLQTQKN